MNDGGGAGTRVNRPSTRRRQGELAGTAGLGLRCQGEEGGVWTGGVGGETWVWGKHKSRTQRTTHKLKEPNCCV